MDGSGNLETGWDERWQAAFQGWIERQRSGSARRDYRRIAGQFFSFCDKRPEAVSTEDVLHWRARLEADEYAASTIRRYLLTVNSLYLEGSRQGLAAANPVTGEALPKAQKYASGRYMSEAEEAALLGAIDVETTWGKRDYALILFLLRSGRRTGEVLGLRWGDFEVTKEGAWVRWVDRLEGFRKARLDWEVWAAIYRYAGS